MKMLKTKVVTCAVLVMMHVPALADDVARQAALGVMKDFLAAFNARDETALADTLIFPHVRLASGRVALYPDKASFVEATDIDAFAKSTGWRRSTWDDMAVIQASSQKVHVRVQFSRFDANDALIATYDSLYVVEYVDGRGGVGARSSVAP
jgi:hypothetical protein